jgi:hypothetical protein
MKIVEVLTYVPSNEDRHYPLPSSSDGDDRDTLQRIINASSTPEFVIDPLGLQPGVSWPGASAQDTSAMPVTSPTNGRDMVRSIRTPPMESERSRSYRNG